jgi:GAF domain-containing protein
LSLDIASQSESVALLERACAGARNLVGSQFAVLAVAEQSADGGVFFTTSGIDSGKQPLAAPDLHAGALGTVLAERRAWRACRPKGTPIDAGLPQQYPQASAFLAVPLMTPARTYGWLCLADKIGADCFDVGDEKLLLTLGGQVTRTFENTWLHAELRRQSERVGRVHRLLRAVQGLIANGQDDEEICRAACSLCVDSGGYQLAFVEIGQLRGGTVEMIAAAGNGIDIRESSGRRIHDRAEHDDLVELAATTRSPAICNDLQATQLRVRRRGEFLARGLRSIAVLPLGSGARRLILARQEPCAFDEGELHLLHDMAAGFSLALARNSEAVIGP